MIAKQIFSEFLGKMSSKRLVTNLMFVKKKKKGVLFGQDKPWQGQVWSCLWWCNAVFVFRREYRAVWLSVTGWPLGWGCLGQLCVLNRMSAVTWNVGPIHRVEGKIQKGSHFLFVLPCRLGSPQKREMGVVAPSHEGEEVGKMGEEPGLQAFFLKAVAGCCSHWKDFNDLICLDLTPHTSHSGRQPE